MVVQDSTEDKMLYALKEKKESFCIPDTLKNMKGIVIVKYKNLYLPAYSGPFSSFSCTSLYVRFYDTTFFDNNEYMDYLNKMELTQLQAIIISEIEPYWGNGTFGVGQIANLKETSEKHKNIIKHHTKYNSCVFKKM